jgi:hypothetical protein
MNTYKNRKLKITGYNRLLFIFDSLFFLDITVSDIPERSLLEKGISFISEEAKWLYHRRPYRAIQEINSIYYNICKPCEFFENDGCHLCGCRIVPNERSALNKLSMATTNCPAPNPKWISTITPPTGLEQEQLSQLSNEASRRIPKSKPKRSCCS